MAALMFIKRKGQRAGPPKAKIEYAHPTHKDFNERLKARQAPRVVSKPIDGPWLSTQALDQLPKVSRAFDLNRDQFIRAQLLDQQKPESQRREEQAGGGSGMVEQDAARALFQPPDHIRKPVDRQHFQGRWIAEQHQAVLGRTPKAQDRNEETLTPSRVLKEPSR